MEKRAYCEHHRAIWDYCPHCTEIFNNYVRNLKEPSWFQELRESFRTGHPRADLLHRLLGDPCKGVEVSREGMISALTNSE